MHLQIRPFRPQILTAFFCLCSTVMIAGAQEPASHAAPQATLHPALFVVGDSIVKTGSGSGESGPWGWGSELIPLFDPAQIHVYNEGRGGRSSRGYIEERLWSNIVERLAPGDFVIIHFGHNDARNSQNHPDRTTITGSGDETIEIGVGDERKTIHTYGWYLRQYVKDAKARDAKPIICSSAPRNTWVDGKIKRGLDGYALWAADAAASSEAFFVDLNFLAANRYDALGQQQATRYFSDRQHTTKAGARLNAECVVEGLKQLRECPLANSLAIPISANR